MAENERIDDAKRYSRRLWNYLPGFEKITGIITKETDSKSYDVDSLLEKMLPHLSEVFNSDIAFMADQKGKILKSYPGESLKGKAIPQSVLDKSKSSNDPITIAEKIDEYPGLKALNIHSIMLLISQMQGKTFWIGVCNGKGEPEPYLGEDKRIFRFIISLFHAYNSGQESEEQKDYQKRYKAALYDGNWTDLAGTSAELAIKYNDRSVLHDFLDAALCEKILKTSLHQETGKTARGQVIEVNKETGCFKVRFFKEDKPLKDKDIEIPIKENRRAALAGARGLLYDISSGQDDAESEEASSGAADPMVDSTGKSEETSTGAAVPSAGSAVKSGDASTGVDNPTKEKWVKDIVEQTTWEKDNDEKDFDCRVDWLRTQWLRIYYLARSGSRLPKSQNSREIKSIYGDAWRKTVALIQEHLKGNPGKTPDTGSIVINSDWLLAFLAQNALLSRNLAEHYRLIDTGSNDMNLLTGARFFSHLSRFILYILHYIRFARREAEYEEKIKTPGHEGPFRRPPFADVPLTPDSSLSGSIIFMVSEYAYREIGVPRELLIFEKLSQQLNFELPLYAANEFYRDHCYHVIDVCLLGEFLLSCDNFTLVNKSGETIFHGNADPHRGDTLKNWYIAALCHDLGYVVERVEKLVGPIEKLKTESLRQFNRSLKDGLKKGKDELKAAMDILGMESDLNIKDELKAAITDRIDGLDHGIIGWLYLCQVLKKLEIPFASMKPALTAILRHNLSEHDEGIHEELLSLLLILCDHLQEWGRPRVVTGQLATGVMEIMRFSPQESYFDRQVHLNQFSIEGMLLENPLRKNLPGGICDRCINSSICGAGQTCLRLWPSIKENEAEIKFKLAYHGDRVADFEPVLSWLFFCRDFQCRKFPFGQNLLPVAIHFSHPPSTIPLLSDEGVSEMDIFEEFANTNEDAAYLCQWIECARNKDRNKKEGIEYTRENDQKDEEFIIHLKKLGRPLTRGMHRQQGRDFIKWKKEWWAEKYIARDIGG